jgi:hypothetical protein
MKMPSAHRNRFGHVRGENLLVKRLRRDLNIAIDNWTVVAIGVSLSSPKQLPVSGYYQPKESWQPSNYR